LISDFGVTHEQLGAGPRVAVPTSQNAVADRSALDLLDLIEKASGEL
jgi:hypothetical protein